MKANKKKANLIFSRSTKQLSKKHLNILAGEWLLNSNIKKNYSYKISKYHWIKKREKLKGFEFVKKTYKKISKSLALYLNKYHETNHSNRYWELILFRFLSFYILFMYDRWKIVENIKRNQLLTKMMKLSKQLWFVQQEKI